MAVDPRSRTVAQVFDLAADSYDDVGVPWFGPVAEALVHAVSPAAGATVLDVGCGKGAATFPLVRRVGPTGRVVGLDLSEGMLAGARARAESLGVESVTWVVGDAMNPELGEGSLDAVVASLVLFFLPEPSVALRAWRDLLRPGGRLGVTTFDRLDPIIDALGDLLDPFLPAQMIDARVPVEEQPFASDGGVERLIVAAGYADVTTRHVSVPVVLRDVEHWRQWSMSLGQRAMWERVPADALPGLMAAAAEVFAARADDDGSLTTDNRIRITLGAR